MDSRRQFQLPATDLAYLERLGLHWETFVENGQYWLVLHDFQLPTGFIQTIVALAILIQPPYPDGPLDMGYFHPHLQRADGKPIARADVFVDFDGKRWQRWSRHRPGECP